MDSSSQVSKSVFREVLRHPNYSKLLTGQVIAAFGDRINQTALLSIVIYVTGNTAKYSADIMFWAILPAVILGPLAVALIDRWNRQRTMIISDLGRAFLALTLPIFWKYIPHHYTIYVMVFLMGIFSALFAPCRLAIMPNLVPQRLLMAANGISSQAGTVATLVAMPLGGWIVENCGRNASFAINAITYALSAFFIGRLRPFKSNESLKESHLEPHPWDDFIYGMNYIWSKKSVLFYVIFTGVTQCLVAIFFVSFLSYGVDVLGQTVGGTNLLFGTLGLGMAGGAIWLGRFSRFGEYFIWPMIMLMGAGIGMLILSRIYNPWTASLTLFGIGCCAVMVFVPVDTFLQKHVPDALRGRVFAARGVLVGIAFLLSLQFSKAVLFHFGALATLQWLGCSAILIGGMGAFFGSFCKTKE